MAIAMTEVAGDLWMTLRQAALALGESRVAVLQRVARGEVEHAIIANRTHISRESVKRLLDAEG